MTVVIIKRNTEISVKTIKYMEFKKFNLKNDILVLCD